MEKPGNIVTILLAGGSGERTGGNFKQFMKIEGKPLLFHSLESFLSCRFIKQIITVVPESKLEYAKRLIKNKISDKRIEIIPGGKTRRESAYFALKHINEKNKKFNYVIFHDASRPLVLPGTIERVLKEAVRWGAAVVGSKALDLIFEVEGEFVSRAHNKNIIYHGFTPQCFQKDLIWKVHLEYDKKINLNGELENGHADNIELLRNYNKEVKVKLVKLPHPDFKLTFKPDIEVIKVLLKRKII